MKTTNPGKKERRSEQEKRTEIEKLHKADREASLKGNFATLITLLTKNCPRMENRFGVSRYGGLIVME
ncbi:MAG: hypothetical protein WBF32_08495 [Candidatus Aminicenantaceae bacterium]